MTQTHLADRQISQPSESSGLKLCGTNQKLDDWVPEFLANEKKRGVECTITAKVHTHAHYTKPKRLELRTVLLFPFMQVDTLILLLQALTAFHYWKKKNERKKRISMATAFAVCRF